MDLLTLIQMFITEKYYPICIIQIALKYINIFQFKKNSKPQQIGEETSFFMIGKSTHVIHRCQSTKN